MPLNVLNETEPNCRYPLLLFVILDQNMYKITNATFFNLKGNYLAIRALPESSKM